MPAERSAAMNVVLVTMDTHLTTAAERARVKLLAELPNLRFSMHSASEWGTHPDKLERCKEDIANGDIIIVTMLFMEDHFLPLMPALRARRDDCDAMICAMSASEVVKLTRMGRFEIDRPASGPMAILKRLRGNKEKAAAGGAQQMKMLRRLPQLLRFIPGTAQDVRAYFLTLQYWLGGSEDNIRHMIRFLIDRYAGGPRANLRGTMKVSAPVQYPEVGVYHPRMPSRMSENAAALPAPPINADPVGTVGLLVLRSYLLAGNSAHYDGAIAALEARGLRVIPAFASGLDARPAIERYFLRDGHPTVDAVVSLSGFSLVGGPAYNDARAAEEILAALDVPYVAAHPVEFQTIEQWGQSERGLMPVESTIMVAIPELDGAMAPMVFGGRPGAPGTTCTGCHRNCSFDASHRSQDMFSCPERAETLAARVARLVELRRARRAQRKVAIVLFNFPPNAGNTGTAAFLSVFESIFATLQAMHRDGYTVDLPASVDELREQILKGNAASFGADANVVERIAVDDHVRREPWLREIESQWGPAPGRQLSDGRSIFVLGARYGNVLVGVQPGLGYEGDPMRLLFERGFAPTHAFSAFYRYLREDFGAHAVLHFGTHGALEFMPGKQTGLSGACWPDRLIGDLPNLYLYAANNPSEGAVAKRRAAATLISYLTPPVTEAGVYRGLAELKMSIERWRGLSPEAAEERSSLAELIQTQAATMDLASVDPRWSGDLAQRVSQLSEQIFEIEHTLIPHGLHVVGRGHGPQERYDLLKAMTESHEQPAIDAATVTAIVDGATFDSLHRSDDSPQRTTALQSLIRANQLLAVDSEIDGILRALDGRYVRPAPGGDLLRTPEILPTGRNLHGFDPFRIPSAYAMREGSRLADMLLQRHATDGHPLPETVALVLWGTDNLKTEGSPIGQALALLGALPRFDSYGRLAGATLRPLSELDRPRIDVVVTLSGIFRDLMPLQIKLLAEAAFLAASADEPEEFNFVRKHALAYQREHRCDLETAALRVFGNADGAYGANVNMLIDNGRWEDENELAETYTRRKGFAYGRNGKPEQQGALLKSVLADVSLACQNLDSVELGVTTIDTYFDTLGGITRAVRRAKEGVELPVYIGDQTGGNGTIRTLSEQVALETRTRMLNPKWYEGVLKHGYEGVRQIELHLTNTIGWSATTGHVQPWVYQQLTETFVLDPAMRERLSKLNPTASAKVASRLIEASERQYWQPDAETLEALRRAGEELEDRLEGVFEGAAA